MIMTGEKGIKERNGIRRLDSDEIQCFLQSATPESCISGLREFFEKIGFRHLDSLMARLYIAMDMYIQFRDFAEKTGVSNVEFSRRFGNIDDMERKLSTTAETITFFGDIALQCIEWRTEVSYKGGTNTVGRAKRYIEEKYTQDDISLRSVAEAMNFTPTYFSAFFKKETGMNFVDYLTQVRIENAKTLLCCTTKMVYEVAYEVGYRDYRYFGQIFKKYTGQTPRQFQNISRTPCGKNTDNNAAV